MADEFQKKTLEFLRAQQDAYLEAVKSWREAMTGGGQPNESPEWPKAPEWPNPPEWPKPPEMSDTPQPEDVAAASYEFASQLLAEQSRFMAELGKAISGSKGKR